MNLNRTKKTLILLVVVAAAAVTACAPAKTVEPETARQTATLAWQTDRQTVWELDWPNAPLGGSLTVETWQAGRRYRYEILEAAAPALVGQSLAFDGQNGWLYNRLNPPKTFAPTRPTLSPVTDAYGVINHLLDTPPQSATQETAAVNAAPAQKISLTYATGDSLAVWLDEKTGLPLKVTFSAGRQQATLLARSVEKLVNPPPELFSVGEWAQNQ